MVMAMKNHDVGCRGLEAGGCSKTKDNQTIPTMDEDVGAQYTVPIFLQGKVGKEQ
jgi:hypothetical protein